MKQTSLEMAFRNMKPRESAEDRIRERLSKLEKIYEGITSCHVYVQAPHRHHSKGNRYEVHIEARVPGTELIVNEKPGDVRSHEDLFIAIRDAFDALERQLKKWKRQRRGEVKMHETAVQGRIAEIHAKGHGHIATTDGRLIYFHKNSVLEDRFDELGEGDPVELVVRYGESDKGPQASTVRPIGRMRLDPDRR